MHHRECYGYQLSWLLTQSFNNIPVVNPPEHGSVVQLKLFQLAAARELGLPIPRTIITNNSDRVREFHAQVGDVVFKPSMGGGICRHLDDDALSNLDTLKASPVTFQERVQGEAIRIVIIGGDVVSCVRIPSDHLDYRADPNYTEGNQIYHPLELDVDIADKCWQLMQACGLLFSGIDLILTPDGSFVFLEANSSPIYLDIEQKTEVAITDALANYLVKIANDPERYRQVVSRARRSRSFVSYALPFHPDRDVN